jgi:tripartite-type tricarboxylate transporter receptor subunit TctC
MMRVYRWLLVVLAASAPIIAAAADSIAYPTKPITFVVAGPPGGSLDVIARVLQEHLQKTLKQTIIVDNRPSASGVVATNDVAKSAPNGYAWLLSFNGPLATAPLLTPKLLYRPQGDLQPVVLTTLQPNLIAVSSKFAPTTLDELLAAIAAKPGKVSFASVGNGSSSHLTMAHLMQLTNTSMLHVPFNGGGLPAIQALVSGDVQVIATVPTTLMPQIAAGRLRAVAVTGRERYRLLPDVATVRESRNTALAQFEAYAWNGVLVRAGTPVSIVSRINAAVNEALSDASVQSRLRAAGLEIAGGSPEDFAKLIANESAKWAPIIRSAAIKLD